MRRRAPRPLLAAALVAAAVTVAAGGATSCGPGKVKFALYLGDMPASPGDFYCLHLRWEAADGSEIRPGAPVRGEDVAVGVPMLRNVPYRTAGSYLLRVDDDGDTITDYCAVIEDVRGLRDTLNFTLDNDLTRCEEVFGIAAPLQCPQ